MEAQGGLGAFINLQGAGSENAAYVCEIRPGGSLLPQRYTRSLYSFWMGEAQQPFGVAVDPNRALSGSLEVYSPPLEYLA